MSAPLTILYHDPYLLAVDKPAGLFVHRSALDPHARDFLLQRLRAQTGCYLYPVHRLDRPTSGIILFALTPEAARDLKAQFDCGAIEKSYLAVLRGWAAAQTVDHPLTARKDPLTERNRSQAPAPKAAQTRVSVLHTIELPFAAGKRYPTSRYTLAALQPLTGRRHQLRRHMKHIAHPIIGDTAYGDLRQNKAFARETGIGGLLLHAQSLTFTHPASGKRLTLNHPPDDERWHKACALFAPAP